MENKGGERPKKREMQSWRKGEEFELGTRAGDSPYGAHPKVTSHETAQHDISRGQFLSLQGFITVFVPLARQRLGWKPLSRLTQESAGIWNWLNRLPRSPPTHLPIPTILCQDLPARCPPHLYRLVSRNNALLCPKLWAPSPPVVFAFLRCFASPL